MGCFCSLTKEEKDPEGRVGGWGGGGRWGEGEREKRRKEGGGRGGGGGGIRQEPKSN